MPSLEEQITAIEDEIRRTPYNKKTQHHIGKLKAKLARLREEAEKRASRRGGQGYGVRKSGNATVTIVGFPSVGKSTLLNQITSARSEVGDYDFTTLEVIPGIMHHKWAKIQILDMPGLISGASKGRGRGRQVLSIARSADLILLMIDVFETNLQVLVEELHNGGIRINEEPPNIVLTKRDRGGIDVNATVSLTRMDEEMVRDILREWGYVNAEIVIREDITEDQLIDYLAGNRVYVPGVVVLNKIDLVTDGYLSMLKERLNGWKFIPISAKNGVGLEELKEEIYSRLRFMRIYLKPQGGEVDFTEPLVVKSGSTVAMVCRSIHKDLVKGFRYAYVWGKSAKFPGQRVGLDHVLNDEDIITLVARK